MGTRPRPAGVSTSGIDALNQLRELWDSRRVDENTPSLSDMESAIREVAGRYSNNRREEAELFDALHNSVQRWVEEENTPGTEPLARVELAPNEYFYHPTWGTDWFRRPDGRIDFKVSFRVIGNNHGNIEDFARTCHVNVILAEHRGALIVDEITEIVTDWPNQERPFVYNHPKDGTPNLYEMVENVANDNYQRIMAGGVPKPDFKVKVDAQGNRYTVKSLYFSGKTSASSPSGTPWRGYNPADVNRHWTIPREANFLVDFTPDMDTQEKLELLDRRGFIEHPSEDNRLRKPRLKIPMTPERQREIDSDPRNFDYPRLRMRPMPDIIAVVNVRGASMRDLLNRRDD